MGASSAIAARRNRFSRRAKEPEQMPLRRAADAANIEEHQDLADCTGIVTRRLSL
jgi:hypothetical protein